MMSCIVHMMAYICTCDVLHSWCDVFDSVGVMTYTGHVMADRMGFKSDIELVLSYSVCDIIYSG